jgi:flagellum-specific peptidoglycan hydrolase FlgJ
MVQQYIQKLKDAGYNSEPLPYVKNVMNIIRQNNFTQYD